MTNGIAISTDCGGTFDYWLDGRCTSGYSHGSRSLELVFRVVLTDARFKSDWGLEMFKKYSPREKLAVPEQLVWWEDE